MSQTGYTPILIYSSSTASNAPAAGNLTNSTLGSELAINIADGKLFYKDSGGTVQVIGWKVVPTTAGGTGLTSYTAGDLLYYATGTTLSKLAIGTAYYQLGVNAGGTAPAWQPSATSVLTTQGDLLYASAANTLARLAKNTTASRYLSNSGTSNNPAWAQIDLTNGVTGTLPVGNGGTGTATAFTAGSVVFAGASGVYSQNNANFFWDNTNNRLGVGTNSPGSLFDAVNSSTSTTAFDTPQIRAINTGTATLNQRVDIALRWADGTYNGTGGISMLRESASARSGSLVLSSIDSSGNAKATLRAFSSGGVSIGNTTDPGANNLYVSGNILVGTTTNTNSAKLVVDGRVGFVDAAGSQSAVAFIPNKGAGATNSGAFGLSYNTVNYTPGSASSNIYWDGGTGYFTLSTSAQRYKRNITPVTDEQLNKALLLKPSYYQRLEYDYWEYGLIAEQVKEIGLEEFVTYADGQISGLNYEKMVTLAFGLIQRQQKTIESLESRLSILENK